jgi:prevent-host-death family protein
MRVTSAEFLRRFGLLTDRALVEPIIITRRGNERLVVMSIDNYRALSTPSGKAKPTPGAPKKKRRPDR